MTEVPIIFPSLASAPQRYTVDYVNKTLRRCPEETRTSRSGASLSEDLTSDVMLCGSASMSSLRFESSGATAILTTSILAEDPGILVVALSAPNSQNSPITVELDLRSKTRVYGFTVRVQAFVDVRNGVECIRLVLVSENAVALIMWLQPENLDPVQNERNFDVVSMKDLIRTRESGAQLSKTMVGFCSPSTLVFALDKLLFSVNLETRTCQAWSESQCKENMKQSAIKSVLDMVFGNIGDATTDMGETAALCVSSTGNPNLDPTYVFTLHSDGMIRRWTVSDETLFPTEVYPITLANLPAGRDWSDMCNSAYLSARLYEQVYVLAVHIQTTYSKNDSSTSASNNHLFVVSGFQDCRGQSPETSSQVLQVPSGVTCLVDMDFVPTLSSCSLFAMFRSTTNDQLHAGTTLAVRYPPSVVSIISTKPEIDSVEYFIDGVAQMERARIEALLFNDELEGVTSTSCLSLEEELHEMDSRFMKYLFRPSYPRGCGAVRAPEDRHIRSAIRKVLYGRTRHHKTEGVSIQLETLRSMQEWCSTENRKILALPSHRNRPGTEVLNLADQTSHAPKLPGASVYDNYVAFDDDEEDDQGDMDAKETEETDSAMDSIEGERVRLLEIHASRWRRFLIAVWEEEQSLRLPLGLFLLPSSCGAHPGSAVLVRAGFTSILVGDVSKNDSLDALAQLDEAALKLIKLIESDQSAHKKILSIEQRMWRNIATAQSDEMVPSDFAEEFSKVVDFAFDSSRGALFSVHEQERLGQSLESISLDELFLSLQELPLAIDLPGLNLLDKIEAQDTNNQASPGHQLVNRHVRYGVNALSVRCIDSSRRLLLARYLLVLHLLRPSHVSTAAFHSFVRSLAVMWVGSQQVTLPSATKLSPIMSRRDMRPKIFQPYGATLPGGVSNRNTMTCLDALLSSIELPRVSGESLTRRVISLSREIYCLSLKSVTTSTTNVPPKNHWKILPELCALPQSTHPDVVTDYPHLALRLIAPQVALASRLEPPNVRIARKETLAQCILLLVDSDQRMSPEAKSTMRVKACELLSLNTSGLGNLRQAKAALELLQSSQHATLELTDQDKLSLAEKLQALLYGSEGEMRNEVLRLLDLETARVLFSCLLRESQYDMDADIEAAVKVLAPNFMFLSDLIRRVDILQNHVSTNKDANDLILSFIKSAIEDLHSLFPSDCIEEMPESLSLYNRLFHVAVSSGEWSQAYDACVNNPSFKRRMGNFKTLLNSMVDAGALGEMLNKFSVLTTPSSQSQPVGSLDLYDIAIDTLEERCSQDLYSMRASAEDAFKAAPDYTGSMYSLHVSRGDWRKAALSLDLRFTNALRALESQFGKQSPVSKHLVAREKLIVEDIVLASVSSANALSLVDGAAKQFIISGDNRESSGLGISNDSGLETRLGVDKGRASSITRIEQFVTHADLQCRAVWSLAFRKLSMDDSVDFSAGSLGPLGGVSPFVDRAAIEQISEGGYLLSNLLLSMATRKTNVPASLGRQLFQVSLDQLLSRALPTRSAESDVSMFHATGCRPSLSQLRYALGSLCIAPAGTPCVITSRLKKHPQRIQASLDALSAALLQKLTCLQTDVDHPIALYVGERFVRDGKSCHPPCWLERLLIRGTSDSSTLSGDFFGGQKEHEIPPLYTGDPSALLSLYLRQGMLLEACHVVYAILDPQMTDAAHCGLPEKGEICFVPHKKIDLLWNLIERALVKEDIDSVSKGKLRDAQELLGQGLEQHFERMKTGELGIRSRRVLKQPTSSFF